VVSKGQVVEVKIDKIDRENKRLSLSLAAPAKGDEPAEEEEDLSQFLRGKGDSMGTLADLLKGRPRGRPSR